MLFFDMILAVAVGVSFIPIMTGYCAYSHGRSFWFWFALGFLLPFASFMLLFALIAREQMDPGRKLLGDARQILRQAEQAAARVETKK